MKASDYVVKFDEEGRTLEALWNIIRDMLIEVRDIGQKRRITTDGALFAILDEMDLKFKSFLRQINGKLNDGSMIHGEAFRRMLRQQMPDIFAAWNRCRHGSLLAS